MIAVRTDDEILPTAPQKKGEKPFFADFLVVLVVSIVGVALAGAIFTAVCWGIWNVFAPIPTFLGYTRFWQDIVAGAVWALILGYFLLRLAEDYDNLSHDDAWYFTKWEILCESPLRNFVGLIAIVIYLASWVLGLAAGLAVCAALAIVVLAGWCACRLIQAVVVYLGIFFASFSAGESGEE